MDRGSVKTVAELEPTAGIGAGSIQLWDGDDAAVWDEQCGAFHCDAARQRGQHGTAVLARMVLRCAGQAGAETPGSGGAEQFCISIEMGVGVVGEG